MTTPNASTAHPLGEAAGSVQWRSCAKWPDGLLAFAYPDHDNTTRDMHDSKEAAEAVCKMLERDGLGGERIHFPVKTWVERLAPNDDSATKP